MKKIAKMLWGKTSLVKPNVRRLEFDHVRMPVWVHLFNVPHELFSKKSLSYIASALGIPLHMDSVTASRQRSEFAKVCIEISVGAVIPKSVEVLLRDGSSFWIRVEVPWLPSSCSEWSNECEGSHGVSGRSGLTDVQPDKDSVRPVAKANEGSGSGIVGTAAGVYSDAALKEVQSSRRVSSSGGNLVEPINVGEPFETSGCKCVSFMKKTKGKLKEDTGKIQFTSPKNNFTVLATIDSENTSLVPEIPARKQRAAALGVAHLLHEMKTKKNEHLEKSKKAGDVVGTSAGGPPSNSIP
ncbi:hypothetical protein F3Y22_tig00000778pilonHSYRG00321 [Hibiscus syriacus]|uniref:Uncharacterized protein n=1 Tax=Hibiscus syriacus TaxID=106335 RepID=A0A6A3D0Q1_HIBSY|nr:hypothetical protein F3Y22_tig00000778pilonHSYRG00321 [Hibiscus syriacus]